MKKLGTFREWLNEEKQLEQLVESAGNLKGLPKNIIKSIVSGVDKGYGGENSEFKLFKTNAKQSDLIAAMKLVGGFIKPEDRGVGSFSKAELESIAYQAAHAGVLVKIDGEWAYYAAFAAYPNKYNLISADGYVNKENLNDPKSSMKFTTRGRSTTFDLTPSDISKLIDFKKDNIDVYLVTSDAERLLKRQKRQEGKD